MAAAGVVACAGLATAALLRAPLPQPGRISSDDAVRVEVVAPVEPVVQPGARMEVGELVDAYEHVPIPARDPDMDVYDATYQTAWIEPPPRNEPRVRWTQEAANVRPPDVAPVVAHTSRFGFDAPTPDYAAERRARQERLDRLQQAAPGAIGPEADPETTFY